MTYIIIYYNFVGLFLKNLKLFDMRKFYFFLITFLALSFGLNAQEITVTGIVTSAEDGWGLPGVTIQVKGTTRGEVTGIDGDYTIRVNSNDVLQFSYVGYQSQEIHARL